MVKVKELMLGCIYEDVLAKRIEPKHFEEPEKELNGFIIPEYHSQECLTFWSFQDKKNRPHEGSQEFEIVFSDRSYFTYSIENRSLFIFSEKHKEEILFEDVIFMHDLQIKVFAVLGLFVQFYINNAEKH